MSAAETDRIRLTALEAELASALTEQTAVFSAAMQLIDGLQARTDLPEPASQPFVLQLQRSLDQVVAAQMKVSSAHAAIQRSGRVISTPLMGQLKNQGEAMRTLLTRMTAMEQHLESARGSLIPRLDGDTRRRAMHSAYQQSLKTV
jgi:hypothetical protein